MTSKVFFLAGFPGSGKLTVATDPRTDLDGQGVGRLNR